jgi:hypothetical protein
MMNISEISYKQFGKCLKVDNGVLELVIPLEFGIRILKLGFLDGRNLFAELPDAEVKVDGKVWHFYGGHRLWLSPETKSTYFPDNEPISYLMKGNTLQLIQPVDTWSGVIKEVEITLSGENVKVTHRAVNKKPNTEKLALWAISVMAPGGFEIVPLKGPDTGWLHNRQISLWPYTKMDDPRLQWFEDYFTLTQDSTRKAPIKIGLSNYAGWGLYINQGIGFLKKYKHIEQAQYPDNNVWYETYTCDYMLELETLSPITETKPEKSFEHVEEWSVFKTGNLDAKDNSSIARFVDGIKEKLDK